MNPYQLIASWAAQLAQVVAGPSTGATVPAAGVSGGRVLFAGVLMVAVILLLQGRK